MPTPPVLLDADFLPLWRHVSRTLDRRGLDDRGWVQLPDGLPDAVFARLGEVAGRRFSTTRRRLDLAALERGLARHGADLMTVLREAGCAPAGRREARDLGRERSRRRDEALAEAARASLGDDPWVAVWVADVRATVPDADAAREAVDTVARVLDAAARPGVRSRAEVAAQVLGGAHRLDRGTPARRWVGAALARLGDAADREDPALWSAAGLPADLVATPVLTWALPLLGDGLGWSVRAATAAGAPAPLTVLSLRDLEIAVPPGTVVRSVENPRPLEAAVQRGLDTPFLCTAGNPTTAPLLLIRALLRAGAEVRHHGDLDPAGLAITGRLAGIGVTPWRMTAQDYEDAVDAAQAEGVELRPVTGPVPETPWDPTLRAAMVRRGVAVDEERVMDALLAE